MKQTKTCMMLSAFVVLLSGFIIGCKEKKATVEELGQMNRDFGKALVAKDAAAAANLYAEDACLLPPNEPMVKGRGNIQKYWQAGIDAGIIGATVHTTAAENDGNLGYEIGTFELKFQDKEGKITIDKGKYTELLKRNAAGKWISIYGMWSADEAPSK